MIKNNRGFTLLELLVVIAIIGILVALGTVSYSTAQKKSRDSKRLSDLKEIQNTLEVYYSVNGQYPGDVPGDFPDAIDNDTYFSGGSIPIDPKCTDGYWATAYTADGYTICADLEVESGTDCRHPACDTSVGNLQ